VERKTLKVFISLLAIAVIAIRIYRPAVKIDSTMGALALLAVLPWLSPVVKKFEAFGIEVEFHAPAAPPAAERREDMQASPPTVQATPDVMADSYLAGLFKLTPIESIATYVVMIGVISAADSPTLLWLSFLALLTLTPILLWRQGVTRASQLVIMTITFVVWAFAIGGPFAYLEWYRPVLGSLALALVTLMAPILVR
jgi:hypothetical protein